MQSHNGATEKHEMHNTDLQTTGIGGKTLPEPLLVAPLTPSPLATCSRGSSSPPGLWDCGSNLYQTLYRASMIRVT
jgi:hypothetical protein